MTGFLPRHCRPRRLLVIIAALSSSLFTGSDAAYASEVQLTFDPHNHSLDNNDNFSPDDKWLIYDTRTDEGGIQAGRTIEKVHIESKEEVTIYAAQRATETGPGIGAASYHPTKRLIVFIHGLLNHSVAHPYAQWRRFGMLVDDSGQGATMIADARDIVPPFTAGALRGGTHRHEFSGDGQWIGFTYNDALMAARGEPFNLRTIGVTRLDRPVMINGTIDDDSFNGRGTSALVVHVTPNPRPGSDEISRAAWDSWIGTHGYERPDGTRQRARAFLGTVRSRNGQDVQELFVVDVPDDITIPGPLGPLQGAADTMPMPPKGASQRRLTHTTNRRFPGFVGKVGNVGNAGNFGHVRSSPDGSTLSCLAKDDNGLEQIFLASSRDGNPGPLTKFATPVESGVRWHPQGRHVCCSQGSSVVVINVQTGKSKRLTEPSATPPFALVWSRDGRTIAFNRSVADPKSGNSFAQIFVVPVEPGDLP